MTAVKRHLKSFIYFWLWALGISALASIVGNRSQKAVTYHHVLPEDVLRSVPDAPLSNSLAISAAEFDRQLRIIRRHLFFANNFGLPGSVLITVDDGFANNIEVIAPILRKYDAAAFFFIPLDTAQNGRIPWYDEIFKWADLAPPGSYRLEPGLEITLGDAASRRQAAQRLIARCDTDKRARRHILTKLQENEPDIRAACSKAYYALRFTPLNRAQIEALKTEGHKVGAHSVHHDRVSTLDAEALRADYLACREAVGDIYNSLIYCYPVGGRQDVTPEACRACRAAGFAAAFINLPRVPDELSPEGDFALPRIFIPAGAPHWVIAVKLSGLENGLRDLIGWLQSLGGGRGGRGIRKCTPRPS